MNIEPNIWCSDRLARVLENTFIVDEAMHTWLSTPNALLDDRPPWSVLDDGDEDAIIRAAEAIALG